MYKDQENKILLGNSIPIPEIDTDNELEDQIDSLHSYWFAIILNSINTNNFKQNYLCVINDIINNCSFEEQKEFCNKILEKISEIYNFEFPEIINFNNTLIKDFYYFLEFLEYNYDKFILNIWIFLSIKNIKKLSIEEYCKQNSDQIIKKIEEQIGSNFFNWFIITFLRTYNKDELMNWFLKSSQKIKTIIKLKFLKMKGENEK